MHDINSISLTDRFLGLLICFLPVCISSLLSKNRIGMGDAKLLGSFGFMLGAVNGYISMTAALVLSVIYGLIYKRIKQETKAHPMAPFICVSGVTVLLIQIKIETQKILVQF